MNKLLERIKKAYHLETDAEVAKFLGIKPSTLSMQKNRGRLNLELIIEKCDDLNMNWLLDGTGKMWDKAEETGVAKVPIYSSLRFTDNNSLDMQNSIKSGHIFTEFDGQGPNLSFSDGIIGYTLTEESALSILEAEDIIFVDLGSKSPKDGLAFLTSSDHQIVCRRVEKHENKYVLSDDRPSSSPQQSSKTKGSHYIIGEIIGVLRHMRNND